MLDIFKGLIDDDRGDRLQKIIAQAGIASRRRSEELIAEGRVRLNGEVATLGDRGILGEDLIEVDSIPIMGTPEHLYYLLNKPKNVISSASDPQGRKTVLDIVDIDDRIYPVGRLDYDSEGLIILTNDGTLTNRLTHPKYKLSKEYLVSTSKSLSKQNIHQLRSGIELEDGITLPAKVSELSKSLYKFEIREGRNRQIRRMVEAVGSEVTRLVRTRIGPISDSTLKVGSFRNLAESELRELWSAVETVD
ncbi:MAG: pseudouridine synthase [Actinomycetota bacterium]|nr:pseudouridine synthase [Actinomycetota bacterium]